MINVLTNPCVIQINTENILKNIEKLKFNIFLWIKNVNSLSFYPEKHAMTQIIKWDERGNVIRRIMGRDFLFQTFD